MTVRPYFNFKNECAQAIELYKRAFNTDVMQIMYFKDIPNCPPGAEQNIMQATLKMGDTYIRMSDCLRDISCDVCERSAIAFECTVEEAENAFAVLSEEGNVGIPLCETFFSPRHGVVFDKFGIMWNIVAQK